MTVGSALQMSLLWAPGSVVPRHAATDAGQLDGLVDAVVRRDLDAACREVEALCGWWPNISNGVREWGDFPTDVGDLIERVLVAADEGRWMDAEMDLDDCRTFRWPEQIHKAYAHAMEHGL
jgi:hypothetical protein